MKFLIVGAGGIGGYFGGRLLEGGADVTFLVRAGRARSLAERGLVIRSRFGDVHLVDPPRVTAADITRHYDVILLSCKAYDLDSAMADIAPAVGPDTAIIPLLNGMRHLDALDARFGPGHILGGLCFISAHLDADGTIEHVSDTHSITFGERAGGMSERVRAISAAMGQGRFDVRPSDAILQDMWEKWVFLATMAGMTCLMRASIGEILAAGGGPLAHAMFDESAAIGAANGHPSRTASRERGNRILDSAGSPLVASMLRDVERGARTEAAHVIGDLLSRQPEPARNPLSPLQVAWSHLQAYELHRAGPAKGTPPAAPQPAIPRS